jgi:hypothetical protein
MGDHPYSTEYAKSSRSKCRGCTDNIEHGLLRIGVTINSQVCDLRLELFSRENVKNAKNVDPTCIQSVMYL